MALQWTQKGNLRGPMGPQGELGADGKTGAGYRTADVDLQANSTVQLSAIHPSTGIQVGDLLVDPQGDVFPVASVGDGTIQTGTATGQNLRGPQGQQGEQGEPGADGTGVTILGSYDSLSDLQEAHPTGNDGDAYMVDGDLYVWSSTDSAWKNVGQIQGPQGPQGVPGAAATVTVGTTSTGDAGTDATVTNGGTTSAAVLNFTIPRGEKGDTGAAGPGVSVGSGAPSSPGQTGECYIDVTTGNLYRYEDAGV